MGVDYSTTVGYGVVIDTDKLPAVLEEYSDGGYFGEECAVEFLKDKGFQHIAYDWVGNMMSGPTYAFFYLPRTGIHGNQYDMDGVHKFHNINLSYPEADEFRKLFEILGGRDEFLPSWTVSFNIS